MFEIETPKDKGDLVRLEDSYGRKLSPYEGKNKERPKDDNCIWIEDPIRGKSNYYSFCDCKILAESILQKDSLYDREGDDIFIFLRGGIVSNEGDPIAQPGDVLNGATLDRLSRVFEITEEIILLSISPEYTGGSGYGCP